MSIWLIILAAAAIFLAALVGVVLTMLTLPGVWLTLLAAIGCQFLFGEPRLFDWWTLGICVGVAVLAEIYEFVSSAAGAARSGGGRSGAIGSILGALAGAILGSFILPIIGTIVGAVLGAGAGALIAERGIAGRSWSHSYRIGQGAAVGRFTAILVKTAVAAAIGLTLFVAVFVK